MAQTTMTFRVDDKLKKDFDKLCDEFGLSNTAALTVFMKTMVREQRIPFEIRSEKEALVRAKGMIAFERLRKEARQNGLTDMTLEEINEEIRAYGRGE
ncbi:MAG: type II toxin-antitoxin system RelB/DinJ family antitoxin [Bacteroidales bacterium]|nr:type II toxin-antitoxin system RelB/DinJ family antitoxin [Bacteroidales bacterium]